jgi:hypothetical protein
MAFPFTEWAPSPKWASVATITSAFERYLRR